AVIAALGGHIDAVFSDFPTAWPQIKSGALHALATGARTRLESLPDVPTIDESGYKDYEAEIWYGLFAPARTPPEVTARLAGWFGAAVQDDAIKAKLAAQGLRPVGTCGAEFRDQVRRQYDAFGRVIREGGTKVEEPRAGTRSSCLRRSAAPAPRTRPAPQAPRRSPPRPTPARRA